MQAQVSQLYTMVEQINQASPDVKVRVQVTELKEGN